MERCPKCGYRGRYDWSALLTQIAFLGLFVVVFGGQPALAAQYRLIARGALGLWLVAGIWGEIRSTREKSEYERLHPGPTERVKEHMRPNPSQ